jgi:hypothetical protein
LSAAKGVETHGWGVALKLHSLLRLSKGDMTRSDAYV